jgi:Ca2+-binding EF-hand superfamily protein
LQYIPSISNFPLPQDTRNVHVQQAFDMTDANGDGHITAHEYASFYVVVAPTFDLSYVQWVQALE